LDERESEAVCELFAMSSRLPANVTFSLRSFGPRGGVAGPHKDGWGIAFKEQRDFRLIKEPQPAADSACLRFIETHEFQSQIVLSHVRLATAPKALSYVNTHPFARELYGYMHVFAHNGHVPNVLGNERFKPSWYFPLGETDSETAFCVLLDRLRAALSPDTAMGLSEKLVVIRTWARELSEYGIFNILLSDSEYLYAHRTTSLFYVLRQCPGDAERFGDEELQITLAGANEAAQRVALLATEPLTQHEEWISLPAGEVVVFHDGEKVV
jgi:predicted glutamine amidotransferase